MVSVAILYIRKPVLTLEAWQVISYNPVRDVVCCPVKVRRCTFQNQILCALGQTFVISDEIRTYVIVTFS
jgi:hypothetical protein